MTDKELLCIEILTKNPEIVNDFYTCCYDNKSGFLTVSFKRLKTSRELKALLVLMEKFNWQIVGINDNCPYGLEEFDSRLLSEFSTLDKHPKYSENWGYVLYKCSEKDVVLYDIGEITYLDKFLVKMLNTQNGKFNNKWEINYMDYLYDSELQASIDRCLYLLMYTYVQDKYRYITNDKLLSVGLRNGVFKLYESDGIGL